MNHRSAWSEHPTSGGAMDFSLTPEQQAFRQTVRAWLRDNIPREWKHVGSSEIPRVEAYELLRTWQRSLFDAGFIGLTWPKEYGGRGLTFMEELILQEEMALAKAPPILNVLGVGMAGPTIIAYGTEDQKKRYPPKILNCEEIWCQGFSEPNAGSDLASLKTRAELKGDEFIVNGQKVWTTFGHIADMCMLLVRTNPAAPKHRGLSYLLVEMRTPGVTVKPLRQMTGEAEFNEMFFDDVRVPRANLLGPMNEGWRVATTTLMNERGTSALASVMRYKIVFDEIVDLARATMRDGRPATEDPVIRQQLAQFHVDLQMMRFTAYRTFSKILKGGNPGPEGSISKIAWSELNQRMMEFVMALEGPASQLMRGSEHAVEGGRDRKSVV